MHGQQNIKKKSTKICYYNVNATFALLWATILTRQRERTKNDKRKKRD